ncbi:MAG TPA: phosphoribosylglycinamide formyltransferase [Candidatus Limnocylindrales bacterium]|nr:phosphoribosylglycinamide formyltransferase [Candidatus Limnocylindrales bacterium]
MKRIAVLASGQGTNLEAILEAVERDEIAGRVVVVISDREQSPALERASRRNVRAIFVNPGDYAGRMQYDQAIVDELKQESVDLVVLAGFMRLISPPFVRAFPMQIMNIHPALLPAFPGLDGVEQALAYGVKLTGCTVHFVDEGLDTGPVILQESVPIMQYDTILTLHQRIHAVEYRLYPMAINLFCRDKLRVEGRRCFIIA